MNKIKSIFLSAAIAAAGVLTIQSCNSDKCSNVVCNNGGTCDADNGTCVCADGYSGTNCDTKLNTKYAGTWSMEDKVTGTSTYSSPYAVTISASSSNGTSLTMDNFGNYGCTGGGNILVPATATATGISAVGTVACGTTWNISGTYATTGNGYVSGVYSATYGSPSTTDNYDYKMTKN